MAELITGGDGTAHVSSADDGALFASIVGTGSYAGTGIGEGLALTVKDANHLTLGTGAAWHNGRGIRVPAQEDVLIESGTQAQRRWDKVVLRYARGTDGVEAAEVHVIKGTPVADSATPAYPPHETGSVLDGAEVSDMPIWGVKVSGITIEGTEKLFTTVPSLSDLLGLIGTANASIKALQDRATAIEAKNSSQDTAINGKAPTSHASADTGYGVGNGSNYGHVKLSDSTTSTSGAGSGIAATPAAVKAVRDSVSSLGYHRCVKNIRMTQSGRFNLTEFDSFKDLKGRKIISVNPTISACAGQYTDTQVVWRTYDGSDIIHIITPIVQDIYLNIDVWYM